MSYDLILWCGEQPVRNPGEVWKALYLGAKREWEAAGTSPTPDTFTSTLAYDDAKALVAPLVTARVLAAFKREFGAELQIETEAGKTNVLGPGWQFSLREGAWYVHVTCSWELARDEQRVTKLRRAALRARCSTYDPQTDVYFQPTE